MTVIGFHCSHEQISPGQLLRDVQHAERAGFTAGFTPGEHDIPEERTPDNVAPALEMVGDLAPRARRVASVCTGAFVLAALGLLDGRRATTHWAHRRELARTYPEVEVVPDALFVEDGPFITGAGINARRPRARDGRERLRPGRRAAGGAVDGGVPCSLVARRRRNVRIARLRAATVACVAMLSLRGGQLADRSETDVTE